MYGSFIVTFEFVLRSLTLENLYWITLSSNISLIVSYMIKMINYDNVPKKEFGGVSDEELDFFPTKAMQDT